jgi:hypothetical protein
VRLIWMKWGVLFVVMLVSVVLVPVGAVRANGNYSHLWMATDALNYVEAGQLRDLVTRPDLLHIIRNGAMFPDGGYAVSDGYGEISHWEPFHLAYLEWIQSNYAPPWSEEASLHIAFLMGIVAHGMADQMYDGMFLKRHSYYDEYGSEATMIGVDGATDACFADSQGVTMEIPEFWVPAEELAPLYAAVSGHAVSAATIIQGQQWVAVALMAANDAVTNPDAIDEYMQFYPWACSNQNNPDVPGSPPTVGPVIARYWEVLWARLHGDNLFDKPLLGTFFSGGSAWDYPTDATSPESCVSFVLPFGLNPSTVNAETVLVTVGDGVQVPINLKVYYGNNSHLVNVRPQSDWPVDTEFTVSVLSPIASWDGVVMQQEHEFVFGTSAEPAADDISTSEGAPDVVEEVGEEVEMGSNPDNTDIVSGGLDKPGKSGCGLSARSSHTAADSAVLILLLGACFALIFRLRIRHAADECREMRGKCFI